MKPLKILVDEMDDGMDEKLNSLGYEAHSVKKLRTEGKKLATDYSIINYAKKKQHGSSNTRHRKWSGMSGKRYSMHTA